MSILAVLIHFFRNDLAEETQMTIKVRFSKLRKFTNFCVNLIHKLQKFIVQIKKKT